MSNHDLRFPIGPFEFPASVQESDRRSHIEAIGCLPERLTSALAGLSDSQMDTPYRPRGWTVRQLVHHVADSHMNSFIRTKLALTQECPRVLPYDQDKWAETADVGSVPVEVSLRLLEALHRRWADLLKTFQASDWARPFLHAEWGTLTLDVNTAIYAWHGRHHTAHVTALRRRQGW